MRGLNKTVIWLASSLALHGLALLGIWTLVHDRSQPAPEARRVVLEIEPVEQAISSPTVPGTSPEPSSPRGEARQQVQRPRRRLEPKRAPEKLAAQPTLPLKMRSKLAPKKLDLSPDWIIPAPESSRGQHRARRPARDQARAVKRRLDGLLARDRARYDLESGRVDPVLYDVQRDAEKLFRPRWSLVDGDQLERGSVGSTTRSFIRFLGKRYQLALKQRNELARGELRDDPSLLKNANRLMQEYARDRNNLLSCDLCVTLFSGRLPQVRLRRSSGKRAFDSMAQSALRKALRLRLPQRDSDEPDQEVCYQFDAKFDRVPPLPVVGCTFEETKLSISCYYPLMKVLKRNVKLVSVEKAQP